MAQEFNKLLAFRKQLTNTDDQTIGEAAKQDINEQLLEIIKDLALIDSKEFNEFVEAIL